MSRLYLASSSPRRRRILREAGLEFTLLRPAPDPPAPASSNDPARLAVSHAQHKALSACSPTASGLVVGADTVVVLGRRILGKPYDRVTACRMLDSLSGRTHRVITGLAVYETSSRRTRTAAEETAVTFKQLSPADIEHYLTSGEPFDKAGAYGIQGRASAFVTRISGSYLNVVGLPLARLLCLIAPERQADGRRASERAGCRERMS